MAARLTNVRRRSTILWPRGDCEFNVRYFSPLAEVPFCGHATIAAAVAVAARDGAGLLVFNTAAGRVDVSTAITDDGPTATLISVPPRTAPHRRQRCGRAAGSAAAGHR